LERRVGSKTVLTTVFIVGVALLFPFPLAPVLLE